MATGTVMIDRGHGTVSIGELDGNQVVSRERLTLILANR